MSVDVFISAGRPFTASQEEFLASLEDYLRANGLNPRAVGRSEFPHKSPLKFIDGIMSQCTATVVVAFERLHVNDGVERRGSAEERQFKSENISTAWNQIESAMAYTKGHPLFVLVENGCRNDGLLEGGYDWYVQRITMTRDTLNSKVFVGAFNNWKNDVLALAKANSQKTPITSPDVDKMTLKQVFTSLRISHLFTLISIVVAYTALLITIVTKVLGK
jgi:hypothetical protein